MQRQELQIKLVEEASSQNSTSVSQEIQGKIKVTKFSNQHFREAYHFLNLANQSFGKNRDKKEPSWEESFSFYEKFFEIIPVGFIGTLIKNSTFNVDRYVNAWICKSYIHTEWGEFAKAKEGVTTILILIKTFKIKNFEKAIPGYVDSRDFYEHMSHQVTSQKKPSDLNSAWRSWQEKKIQAGSYLRKAKEYLDKKLYSESWEYITEALNTTNSSAMAVNAFSLKSLIHIQRGEYKKFIYCQNKALEYHRLSYSCSDINIRIDKIEKARSLSDRMKSCEQSFVLQRYDDTIKYADEALKIHPENKRAHELKTFSLYHLNKHVEGDKAFAFAMSYQYEFSEKLKNKILCLIELRNNSIRLEPPMHCDWLTTLYEKTKKELNKVSTMEEVKKIVSFYLEGKLTEATTKFDVSLESTLSIKQIEEAYRLLDRDHVSWEAARSSYMEFFERIPTCVSFISNLIKNSAFNMDYYVNALRTRALIHRNLGEFTQAIECINITLDLLNKFKIKNVEKAILELVNNRDLNDYLFNHITSEEKLVDLQNSWIKNKSEAQWYINQSIVCSNKKLYMKAQSYLKKALQISSSSIMAKQVWSHKSAMHLVLGEYENYINCQQEVLKYHTLFYNVSDANISVDNIRRARDFSNKLKLCEQNFKNAKYQDIISYFENTDLVDKNLYELKAFSLQRLGKHDEADIAFLFAISYQSDFSEKGKQKIIFLMKARNNSTYQILKNSRKTSAAIHHKTIKALNKVSKVCEVNEIVDSYLKENIKIKKGIFSSTPFALANQEAKTESAFQYRFAQQTVSGLAIKLDVTSINKNFQSNTSSPVEPVKKDKPSAITVKPKQPQSKVKKRDNSAIKRVNLLDQGKGKYDSLSEEVSKEKEKMRQEKMQKKEKEAAKDALPAVLTQEMSLKKKTSSLSPATSTLVLDTSQNQLESVEQMQSISNPKEKGSLDLEQAKKREQLLSKPVEMRRIIQWEDVTYDSASEKNDVYPLNFGQFHDYKTRSNIRHFIRNDLQNNSKKIDPEIYDAIQEQVKNPRLVASEGKVGFVFWRARKKDQAGQPFKTSLKLKLHGIFKGKGDTRCYTKSEKSSTGDYILHRVVAVNTKAHKAHK